uniref:Uncharacterized protein n=1 Tax=Skeletonema marinoi TaxID=267567 RepID=A0A7S2LUM8_9STRA|mmetsp:Transcript_29903/g.50938  ORF Transcript_29903/g.50938 Transcript_29903/m.50938 type:complete len:193 (+) Transcript_29903:720-1298(+)
MNGGEPMDDINSLIELELKERRKLERRWRRRPVRNEEEETIVRDLSEQLVGDMFCGRTTVKELSKGHTDKTDKRPTIFPTCFNQGNNYFNGLCGCIDTTDEEGTSSWAMSIMDDVTGKSDDTDDTEETDETSVVSDGHDSTSVESWTEADTKIDSTKKIFPVKSSIGSKKLRKTPRWKKVFRRSEKTKTFEC